MLLFQTSKVVNINTTLSNINLSTIAGNPVGPGNFIFFINAIFFNYG